MDIYLRGGSFRSCTDVGHRAKGRGSVASASRSRRVRRLWGRDKGGRFRTHGRNSQATVRGTRWVTVDRCDGTFTRVTEGAVSVRDKVRHRTRAGARRPLVSRQVAQGAPPRAAPGAPPPALGPPPGRWVPLPLVERYDPKTIEPKWQKVWADERTWEVSNEPGDKPMAYVLEMLPYTSGEPHIGHLKNYAVGDAVAHFHRRRGASRAAPDRATTRSACRPRTTRSRPGMHPRQATDESIAAFREQFRSWGVSFDWTREVSSHEPDYYRWTQWIFLRLFERGLAYRKEAAVKWCPVDQTVLANEQVIDGRCERCGNEVEVKQLEQWFFRITEYADRLLDDMKTIEWPPHVVTMQENWIGRSEGAEVIFRCEELGIDYPVFTTRPDTLFGATFFVLAPEHPDVLRLNDSREVHEYVNHALNESAEERGSEHKQKTGVRARPDGHEPGHRRADPDVRGRLRADGVRHRRGHGRAGARRARLRVRERRSASRSGA